MRENASTKAARYLTEGRLTVTLVAGDNVGASCKGNGSLYQLGHSLARGWWCSCPAKTRCCHLLALMLVVVAK